MFFFAALFFIGFGAFYAIMMLAIIYHLFRYSFPQHPTPLTVVAGFLALSALVWASAAYFLFQIPA